MIKDNKQIISDLTNLSQNLTDSDICVLLNTAKIMSNKENIINSIKEKLPDKTDIYYTSDLKRFEIIVDNFNLLNNFLDCFVGTPKKLLTEVELKNTPHMSLALQRIDSFDQLNELVKKLSENVSQVAVYNTNLWGSSLSQYGSLILRSAGSDLSIYKDKKVLMKMEDKTNIEYWESDVHGGEYAISITPTNERVHTCEIDIDFDVEGINYKYYVVTVFHRKNGPGCTRTNVFDHSGKSINSVDHYSYITFKDNDLEVYLCHTDVNFDKNSARCSYKLRSKSVSVDIPVTKYSWTF